MNHNNAGFVVVGGDGGCSVNTGGSSGNGGAGRGASSAFCVVCGVSTPVPSPATTAGSGSPSSPAGTNRASYATSVVLPASKRTLSDRVVEILNEGNGGSADPNDIYRNSAVVCSKCFTLVSKVDSLELLLQGAKAQLRQLHSNRNQPGHQQPSAVPQGNGMSSAYGQITAIYDTGAIDYHRHKKSGEQGSSSSSSGDNGEFMMSSQQHHQQQGGGGQLHQQQQQQQQSQHQQQQQQHPTTATGMRFIAAANAGFFTMNGIPQFSNAVPVSVTAADGSAAHQFLLNQQCLPISLAAVAGAGGEVVMTAAPAGAAGGIVGRNGDAGVVGDGACFQMPLQRAAFFRAAAAASTGPVTSPGPSSSASGGHVESSSPDGSISDFPVMPKAEMHSESDSDVSGAGGGQGGFHPHHGGHGGHGHGQHHGQAVHPSNVGHLQSGQEYGSSIAVKVEGGDDGPPPASSKRKGAGSRGKRRGRGQGRGGGGRGPNQNINFNVPGAKYPCEVCGQPFKTKQGLSLHRWRLHRVRDKLLKLFPCEHCGKDFNALSKLRDHKLIHTGEKPHGCPYCEYRCALFGNLNHHIRKVHKSKPALLSQAAQAGTGTTVNPPASGSGSQPGGDSSQSQHSDGSPAGSRELDMEKESDEDDDCLDADQLPSPRSMLGVPSASSMVNKVEQDN